MGEVQYCQRKVIQPLDRQSCDQRYQLFIKRSQALLGQSLRQLTRRLGAALGATLLLCSSAPLLLYSSPHQCAARSMVSSTVRASNSTL
jgi:hypothetical protein